MKGKVVYDIVKKEEKRVEKEDPQVNSHQKKEEEVTVRYGRDKRGVKRRGKKAGI